MTKEKKVWLWTIILWVINIKIFALLSNWEQTWQIFKYSENLVNFYRNIFQYYFEFVNTIPTSVLFLTIIFTVELFIFWFYYFKVYFYKLPPNPQSLSRGEGGNKIFVILGTMFSFLGFGCVACGQTLLSSLLFLFVSNGTMYFADMIGNLVIVFGILLLAYGIYRNYKLYKNPGICKI